MTRKDLDTAMDNARRFLARAEEYAAEHDRVLAEWAENPTPDAHPDYVPDPPDGRLAASVKRASLELTYALPALRRSR